MFNFLALVNLRAYIIISCCVGAFLLLFVIFDTSRQMVNLVNLIGANTRGVLGSVITNFVTVPINWAVSDYFGAIVAAVLWPLAALWLAFFILLFIFSFIAPLIGWTLDWGRIFDF